MSKEEGVDVIAEKKDSGLIKLVFSDAGTLNLPPIFEERKIEVHYTINTPDKVLSGDSHFTLSPGHWFVSVGYVKEDYTIKDELFGDRLMKKDTVVVQPIKIA